MGFQCMNAATELQEDLYAALSDVFDGKSGFIWVPARHNANRANRNAYVIGQYRNGLSAASIAEELDISERTVWRILARARVAAARSGSSDGLTRRKPRRTER